jgi:hypothetical protein
MKTLRETCAPLAFLQNQGIMFCRGFGKQPMANVSQFLLP